MPAASPSDVCIICPLYYEARVLRRCVGPSVESGARVLVCGPGASAAAQAATACAAHGARLVVLAGLAGGLTASTEVPSIARVIDARGNSWQPSLGGASHEDAAVLLGVDRPAATPGQKRDLRERTGADLVDMESHGFAQACTGLGLSWGVVRGVSDAFDESLPPEMLHWVDPAGRTRAGRVAMDILKRPRLIADARRIGARSGRVLPLVGERVAGLVREWRTRG